MAVVCDTNGAVATGKVLLSQSKEESGKERLLNSIAVVVDEVRWSGIWTRGGLEPVVVRRTPEALRLKAWSETKRVSSPGSSQAGQVGDGRLLGCRGADD